MRLLVSGLFDRHDALRKESPVSEYEFSEHAYDMLRERNIEEVWVRLLIEEPERKELKDDGTVHHIRAIEQYGGRYLRVVVGIEILGLSKRVPPRMLKSLLFETV